MTRLATVTLTLAMLTTCASAAEPNPAALVRAGHWKRARAALEPRYRANPNDAEANYLLSQVKLAFGDLDAALKLAEKAVALDANNANYHYQLAVTCGETAQKASLFTKAHWANRFRTEAEQAASLDPKNLDARFGLLEFYLQAPRLMGGGKDKAKAMAEEIAKIDPVEGELAQARLAQDQKDRTKEREAYTTAVAAGPKTYDSKIEIANFFLEPAVSAPRLSNPTVADSPADPASVEKFAREAIKLDSGRVEAYSILARLYSTQHRWTDLDSILGEAEKKVPDNFRPCYRAASVLLAQGVELARAERYFRKYLSQEPEGESPTLAETHWQLGLVLEKEGRRADAVSEIEAAIRLDPALEKAKSDLKRIKG